MSQDELDELFGEAMEIDNSSTIIEEPLKFFTKLSDSEAELDGESESEVDAEGDELTFTNELIDLTLPTMQKPASLGMIPYVLKLPGFIGSKRVNFEGASTLQDELVETEFCEYGDLLRARSTIRNRKSLTGTEIESNTRLNRWSDGSWTLQIGFEHFEVLPQAFGADENNFLFMCHQQEECLESVGKLANKLTVRPFMDSQGTHRKYLALAEATGKGMKKVKVRVATTTADPEKQMRGLVKIQQERIKARRKLDAKRRNLEQRSFDRVGKEGLTARFLEADEDEEFEGSAEDDEYDADFIDDGDIDTQIEEEAEEEPRKLEIDNDSRSRTSRLIFDDDEDED